MNVTFFEKFIDCIIQDLGINYYTVNDPDNTGSFEHCKEMYKRYGLLEIDESNSGQTIYSSSEYNIKFRAWHDYVHITNNFPFTYEGEEATKRIQQAHVNFFGRKFGLNAGQQWAACLLLDIEITDQLEYYIKHGTHVEDQYEFTVNRLKERGAWELFQSLTH